jgi:hypothetical protein
VKTKLFACAKVYYKSDPPNRTGIDGETGIVRKNFARHAVTGNGHTPATGIAPYNEDVPIPSGLNLAEEARREIFGQIP